MQVVIVKAGDGKCPDGEWGGDGGGSRGSGEEKWDRVVVTM